MRVEVGRTAGSLHGAQPRVQTGAMTDLLEKAMETARALPPALQDDIARVVLALAGDDASIYQLTQEEEADLAESDAEVARGDFATDEEVRAMWAKHGS